MSNYKYGCCARVFTSYYVCIRCNKIFHKGCIASGKYKEKISIIDGYKINCCMTEAVDLEKSLCAMEEKNAALEDTSEVSLDIKMKTLHLEKLKRDYEHLLNEATLRGTGFKKIISDNEKTINKLKDNISILKSELRTYTNR